MPANNADIRIDNLIICPFRRTADHPVVFTPTIREAMARHDGSQQERFRLSLQTA
jgi:hypothetical protein